LATFMEQHECGTLHQWISYCLPPHVSKKLMMSSNFFVISKKKKKIQNFRINIFKFRIVYPPFHDPFCTRRGVNNMISTDVNFSKILLFAIFHQGTDVVLIQKKSKLFLHFTKYPQISQIFQILWKNWKIREKFI
jgi:hypothetical protein